MKALVCGAGGFIGNHLVRRLKAEGYWVRGVGRREPSYCPSDADEYLILDLSRAEECDRAFETELGQFDEVYQLAAEMGGIGFIESAACEILRNSTFINLNMIQSAIEHRAKRYFLASSACVYRDMQIGESELSEEDAYPANPNSEYGWEKLYSERVALTFAENHGMELRIARLQTSYGPCGPWTGGKEKAPCALCRKVAEA